MASGCVDDWVRRPTCCQGGNGYMELQGEMVMVKRLIIVAAILTVLFSGMSLTGCGDTWEGFGEDVEDVGEDIQD